MTGGTSNTFAAVRAALLLAPLLTQVTGTYGNQGRVDYAYTLAMHLYVVYLPVLRVPKLRRLRGIRTFLFAACLLKAGSGCQFTSSSAQYRYMYG